MPSVEQDVLARTYTVVAGDTLTRISARTGVSVADLTAFNGIADPDRIEVGRVLRLDAPAAVADGTSAASRLQWGDPSPGGATSSTTPAARRPRSGSSPATTGRATRATDAADPRTPRSPTER